MRKLLIGCALVLAAFAAQPGSAVVDSDEYHYAHARLTGANYCLEVWGYQSSYANVEVVSAAAQPWMDVWAYVYADPECSGAYEPYYGSSSAGDTVSVVIDPTAGSATIAFRLVENGEPLEVLAQVTADPLAPPPFDPYVSPGDGLVYDGYARNGSAVALAEGAGFSSEILTADDAWLYATHWLALG